MSDLSTPITAIRAVSPAMPSSDFTQATAGIEDAGTVITSQVDPTSKSSGFATVLDQISAVETKANDAAIGLATGQLKNPHEFTAAAAQARLTVQLTAAVRNRALDAFNEVMRMQV